MSEISSEWTRKVAQLARLKLTEAESAMLTSQFESILEYFNQLNEVDVTDVEPMTHPHEMETYLRGDVVEPTPVDESGRPKVLSSAPEVEADGFKVPPIL